MQGSGATRQPPCPAWFSSIGPVDNQCRPEPFRAKGRQMRIFLIIVAVLIALGLESVLLVFSYGQFAERSLGPPSTALPVADNTELDRLSASLESSRNGETGLAMLTSGVDAFAARALASRAAG